MKWIGQHIWDFISRFRSKVYLEDVANAGSDTDAFLVKKADGEVAIRTGAEVLSDIGASSESTDLEFSGDTANGVLTYGGAAQIDVESTLTYDPSLSLLGITSSNSGSMPYISLQNSHSDPTGPVINFAKTDNGATNDVLGTINWQGDDAGGVIHSYASIVGKIEDATNTEEAGSLQLKVSTPTLTTGVLIDGDTDTDGRVDVTIGANAASLTTIAGNVATDGGTFLMRDPTDSGDFFNINVTTHGVTTLTTIDDDATAANLTLDADGEIILDGADPYIRFYNNGTEMGSVSYHHNATFIQLKEDGGSGTDYFNIKAAEHGASEISTFDGAGANADLSFDVDGQMFMQCTDEFYSFGKNDDATTTIERLAHDDGNGGAFKIRSGYATAGQTNKNGGDLHLVSGASTGSGTPGSINFEAPLVGSTGTSLNSPNLLSTIAADPLSRTTQRWFEDAGASTSDYFSLNVIANGATTLKTVDAAGTDADLLIIADGTFETRSTSIHLNSAGGIVIDADNGEITFKDDTDTLSSITSQGYAGNRKFTKTADGTHFEAQGDILYLGGGSTTQGDLCYLKENGEWGQADADGAATGDDADRDAMGMLAIALGTDPDVDGMLVRGVVTMDYDLGDVGNPIYVSTTASDMTATAPTASGDFVRVVGYCLDDTHGQIWFNPDSAWVEIA